MKTSQSWVSSIRCEGLHGILIRVLVGIIIRIDSLGLKSRDGVKPENIKISIKDAPNLMFLEGILRLE